MAAYRVSKDGKWAESHLGVIVDGRMATDEEAEIMDKIVWQKDTPADRERLHQLLQE